jgi:lipopolysaccharide transport system ATP-binding protein
VGVANRGFDIGSFEEYLLLIHEVDVVKVLAKQNAIIYAGVFNINPKVQLRII